MSSIQRFIGKWGEKFKWQGARSRYYDSGSAVGATETWLIGKREKAENFAMRSYDLEPGGHSREEDHPYDHGVLIIAGSGEVLLGGNWHPIKQGDVIYIEPNENHQLRNTGDSVLSWICIIPAKRFKQGKMVWAEEGLEDQLKTTEETEQ